MAWHHVRTIRVSADVWHATVAEPNMRHFDRHGHAAVHARYVGNTETRIEQRGITAARLEALIGFMPGQAHLQVDLNASHTVHQDLRLHPLLVGRRQVPPEQRHLSALRIPASMVRR